MNTFTGLLKKCQAILEDPYLQLKKKAQQGELYCGYLCIFVPEELIHAAGVTPVRLFGAYPENDYSEKYLHGRACEYARNLQESFNRGIFDFLSACVFARTCDTLQAVFRNLSATDLATFYINIPPSHAAGPQRLREASLDLLDSELQRFKSFIEQQFHTTLTESALRKSIQVYALNAKLMEELSVFRTQGSLSSMDYFTLAKTGYFLRKEEHNTLLQETLNTLTERDNQKVALKKKGTKILLSGFLNGNMRFLDFLGTLGLDIVADDLCEFSRYFTPSPSGGDSASALRSVGHRVMGKKCPLKVNSVNYFEFLKEKYEQSGAEGIIMMIYPFCDPQSLDLTWVRPKLKQEGIHSLIIQPTLDLDNPAQIETRVEAFIEMIND